MDYKRFFTFEPILNNKAILKGNEFIHATRVLRLKIGYKIIINDDSNKDYYCSITEINKDELIAEVESEVVNDTYDDIDITLYIGICKDIDNIIQKAVEMGVKEVIPFTSQHTNIKTVNISRLNKIILESSKQCGRPNLMKLSPIISFSQAISQTDIYDKVLFFYEQEKQNKLPSEILLSKSKLAIFIGGEGGFAVEEINIVQERKIPIFTLGKRILRVETAVVVALTLCLKLIGKL